MQKTKEKMRDISHFLILIIDEEEIFSEEKSLIPIFFFEQSHFLQHLAQISFSKIPFLHRELYSREWL